MKITALIENTTQIEKIETEHGLSLYIEVNGKKILFDMGQTTLFEANVAKLSVNLSEIDIAVLSHGHYDHGGGLKHFLEINSKANVYMSKYAFEPHYNGAEKYIGLDTSLKNNERIIFTDDKFEIEKGLTLYSCNDRKREKNLGSFGLNVKIEGELVPDDFRHEQYFLIEENGSKVLISGCSHKGIMDIVNWFKPNVLIGGFHYSKLPLDEKLKSYSEYLDSFDTVYYTCHCTGTEQYKFMKKYMENLNYLSCGESIMI